MHNIIYSLIIPHRDCPKLLERCLYSVPSRKDLEIIVVDDNSTQNPIDFEKYPNLNRKDTTYIYEKSHKYAGNARNRGMAIAKGKWILFADADDFFNYSINDILDEYRDDESDIIFFKVNSLDSEDYSVSNRGNNRLNKFIDHYKEDPVKYGNLLKYQCGEPWSKLIKKRIIDENKIQFEAIVINGDHRFAYQLGFCSKYIKVDNRALYCATSLPYSASKNKSDEAILTRIRVFTEAELFFKKNNLPSYIYWDLHYELLATLYYENRRLFKEACNMLQKMGFTSKMLNLNIACHDFHYSWKPVLYAKSIRNKIIKKTSWKILYRTYI